MNPAHLFLSSPGDLHDTRAVGWHLRPPLRPAYAVHYRMLATTGQLKASLRAGGHVWPGGYAIAYICSDGETLCPDCVRANLRVILEAVKEEAAGGWHVVALTHEGETDARLDCAQCSKVIAEGANEV